MTPKQTRFVAEYLIDLNATQAAVRAGYSAKNADVTGPRLLGNVGIAEAVAKGTARQLEKAELTAIATLEAVRRQVCGDIRNLFDNDGNLIPIKQLKAEDAAMIAGFEAVIKNAAAGDGHTDLIHKVKLKDQARFVEMAMKHFGLLVESLEHKGEIRIKWLDSSDDVVGSDTSSGGSGGGHGQFHVVNSDTFTG